MPKVRRLRKPTKPQRPKRGILRRRLLADTMATTKLCNRLQQNPVKYADELKRILSIPEEMSHDYLSHNLIARTSCHVRTYQNNWVEDNVTFEVTMRHFERNLRAESYWQYAQYTSTSLFEAVILCYATLAEKAGRFP